MKVKNFEFIVHTWMYGKTDIEKIAERVSKIGMYGLDLSISLDPKRDKAAAAALGKKAKKAADDCGLKIPVTTALAFSETLVLCNNDEGLRQKAVDCFKRCVDVTVEAGADRMLVVPSAVSVNRHIFTTYEEDWQRGVQSLREVGEYAQQNKIMLMVEPINRYRVCLVRTVAEALKMAKEIGLPNIYIVPDTFHMQIEEINGVAAAIREGGSMIKVLHLGDNTRRPPGYGVMDWKDILRALYEISFDGYLSYEPAYADFSESRMYNDSAYADYFEAQLKFSMDYLRQQMAALNAKL